MTAWAPDAGDAGAVRADNPVIERLLGGDLSKGPRGTGEYSFLGVAPAIPEQYLTGILAESWEISSDKLVFHIRPGVYYTGNDYIGVEPREFTAEDVKYNLDYYCSIDQKTFHFYMDFVDSVTCPDKYTAEVKLKYFNANWPVNIGYCWATALMMPREMVEAGSGDWRNHFGTGPFMLNNWTRGVSLEYVRNPNYWDTTTINGVEYEIPFVDKLVFPVILDWATKISALRTGKLDLCVRVPEQYRSTILDTCPDILNKRLIDGEASRITFKFEEGKLSPEEPFTDIRVRQAMSCALDRDAILESVYFGVGEVFCFPMAPLVGEPAYTPLEKCPSDIKPFYEYNPDLARQLMADADYPDGFECEMLYLNRRESDTDLNSMVKDYWADIGIVVNLKPVDVPTFNYMRTTYDYPQLMAADGCGTTAIPLIAMPALVDKGSIGNHGNYCDPDLEIMAEKLIASSDIAERDAILHDLFLEWLRAFPTIGMPRPSTTLWWWPWLRNYYGEADTDYFGNGYVGARMWYDQDMKAALGY